MLQKSNPAHEFASFETLQQKLDVAMEIIVNSTTHTIFQSLMAFRVLYWLQ